MAKVVYQMVEHDGGWTYRADGVYSETYRSHDAARAAAEHAAREQRLSGEEAAISYEDAEGDGTRNLLKERTALTQKFRIRRPFGALRRHAACSSYATFR